MKKILISSLLATGLLTSSVYAEGISDNINMYTNYQNAAGYLNQMASSIADQLSQNKDFADLKNTPIAVMSIVNLENFNEITRTTNLVTENLIHEMQIRGYKVIDFKAMPTIKIGSNGGDYLFSRDLSDLHTKQNINYALSGTYSFYNGGLALNLRIVNLQDNVVLSTAQVFIPKRVIREIERDSRAYSSNFQEEVAAAPFAVDITKR